MIREELKLSKARLPEAQVESAWCALDKDKSGFITIPEFGAFMKQGLPEVRHAHAPSLSWKPSRWGPRLLCQQGMRVFLEIGTRGSHTS